MSMFIYISHKKPIEALIAAEALMDKGYFPFIPQLNKLLPGRSDKQWEDYFKMWLFKCDIYLCNSYRPHELAWATENHIQYARNILDVERIKLPPFGELGRKFGEEVAFSLDPKESWRTKSRDEVLKEFENTCGNIVAGSNDPMTVARLALQAWDREHHG